MCRVGCRVLLLHLSCHLLLSLFPRLFFFPPRHPPPSSVFVPGEEPSVPAVIVQHWVAGGVDVLQCVPAMKPITRMKHAPRRLGGRRHEAQHHRWLTEGDRCPSFCRRRVSANCFQSDHSLPAAQLNFCFALPSHPHASTHTAITEVSQVFRVTLPMMAPRDLRNKEKHKSINPPSLLLRVKERYIGKEGVLSSNRFSSIFSLYVIQRKKHTIFCCCLKLFRVFLV